MNLLLSDDELRDLTGYKRAADQCRWLEARKWKFELSVSGKPRLSRAYVESRLSDNAVTPKAWEPDFSAL